MKSFFPFLICFCLFSLTACKTEPVKGSNVQAVFEQALSLKAYSAIEVLPLESLDQPPQDTLNLLYTMVRSALVRAECFQSVNGLRPYAKRPSQQERIVLLKPTLLSYSPEESPASLCIRFDFEDSQTHLPVGSVELRAEGGELGINAAIQRLMLALQDHVRLAILGF